MSLFQRELREQIGKRDISMQRQLRQPRRAKRRADSAAGAEIKLLAAYIRQHLPPVGAARAAANQRDALRFDAAGVNRIHAVRQSITESLQPRPRPLRQTVLMSQAEKDAFRLRIVVRRAFTREIRQEPDRIGIVVRRFRCRNQRRNRAQAS